MAAKKKTAKKKKVVRKATPAPRRAPAVDLAPIEASLARIESRLDALENRPAPTSGGNDDLANVLRPAVEAYRDSMRTRDDERLQTPWVMAGLVLIFAITVAILGNSGTLSGDSVAILITASVAYALFQLRKVFT